MLPKLCTTLRMMSGFLLSAGTVAGMAQSAINGGPQDSSKPTTETHVKAGSPFGVTAHFQTPVTGSFRATATYESVNTDGRGGGTIDCLGNGQGTPLTVDLQCTTTRQTLAGEYRSLGRITLTSMESNEEKPFSDVRLPIVTIDANPFPPTQFPTIVGASLLLERREVLADGSRVAGDLLDTLSAEYSSYEKDSKQTRAYFREKVRQAKTINRVTGERYLIAPSNGNAPLPIFFQDFDRRLQQVLQEVGGGSLSQARHLQNIESARFVLAQLPTTHESVDAQDQSRTLRKPVRDLVEILLDMKRGFLLLSDSGTTTFTWSATTSPEGAEIWISRLGEPETKWAGSTNVKEKKLEYAIWTFRFSLNGCSKPEQPDPYLQAPIEMKVKMPECKSR